MDRACAKINLGLNIVGRRDDGYHDIQTVFLPIPLFDTLQLERQADDSMETACHLAVDGNKLDCDPQKNLVVKAYNLLKEEYNLPRVRVTLVKRIPSQAGMGGGSSDAACMLRLLNEHFHLGLSSVRMERYAAQLGADCAVFVRSLPAYAEGIGDRLYHIPGIYNQLCDKKLAIVKPEANISTHEAYSHVRPHFPEVNALEMVMQPIETWREHLTNDFEDYAFKKYVALKEVKHTLYRLGAVYASMTGSGSAIYAFMPHDTSLTRLQLRRIFPECYTALLTLSPSPSPSPSCP